MWHRLGAICAQQKWSDVVLVYNSNGLTIHLVITTQSLLQSGLYYKYSITSWLYRYRIPMGTIMSLTPTLTQGWPIYLVAL